MPPIKGCKKVTNYKVNCLLSLTHFCLMVCLHDLPPANRLIRLSCLFLIGLAMLIASIHPLDWSSYAMHQLGTLIFVAGMIWLHRRFGLRAISWIGSTGFLLLHILGARYLYSYVPYDEWFTALFGTGLSDVFGWKRNMYDRLVHFAYGLLLFPLMWDVCKRIFIIPSPAKLFAIVLMLNMSTSMIYELIEWGIAMSLSPKQAESYNGQQGDVWDAHKDMALALLGGILAGVFGGMITPFFSTKKT